jgi:hypothetical protein
MVSQIGYDRFARADFGGFKVELGTRRWRRIGSKASGGTDAVIKVAAP